MVKKPRPSIRPKYLQGTIKFLGPTSLLGSKYTFGDLCLKMLLLFDILSAFLFDGAAKETGLCCLLNFPFM